MSTPTLARPALRRPAEVTGWAPLTVVLAGTFVTFLDFFIVNVGLPAIAADLHAGPAALSLVVAGYGLTFAAGMITDGRLGDPGRPVRTAGNAVRRARAGCRSPRAGGRAS